MSDELNEEEQDQEENLAYLGGLVPCLHFQGLFPAAMQQEYNGKKGFKDGKSQDPLDFNRNGSSSFPTKLATLIGESQQSHYVHLHILEYRFQSTNWN